MYWLRYQDGVSSQSIQQLEVVRFRLRILVVVSIGITGNLPRNVHIASFVIQLSVQLQGCIRRHTLIVTQRTAIDGIYTDTSQRVIVRIENLPRFSQLLGALDQTVKGWN